MPTARDADEELSAEPWFYVGENDFFPEEFRAFLGLPERWREVFTQHHADLFDVDFWTETQARLRAGEVIDIFPYPQSKRLGARNGNSRAS
jgi:isocitrate dehydrogenase kinase/phosphatase